MGNPPTLPRRLSEFDSYGNGRYIGSGSPKQEQRSKTMSVTEDSLSHTRRECKYHVVFIPKYMKKTILHNLRNVLGEKFHEFALQRESRILEGHIMVNHVHMLITIPPKYNVSQVVGYIKGESAIWIARNYFGRDRNYVGQHFWARGYYVSTVGREEKVIAEYIRNQEKRDADEDRQLGLGF